MREKPAQNPEPRMISSREFYRKYGCLPPGYRLFLHDRIVEGGGPIWEALEAERRFNEASA